MVFLYIITIHPFFAINGVYGGNEKAHKVLVAANQIIMNRV